MIQNVTVQRFVFSVVSKFNCLTFRTEILNSNLQEYFQTDRSNAYVWVFLKILSDSYHNIRTLHINEDDLLYVSVGATTFMSRCNNCKVIGEHRDKLSILAENKGVHVLSTGVAASNFKLSFQIVTY